MCSSDLALGRNQPIRPHGTCTETLSISDTRVNITILGDGGDTLTWGSACADPNTTKLIGEDPSAAQIIQIRGKNITVTGLEISGQTVFEVPTSFLNNQLGLFDGVDFDSNQCTTNLAKDPACNNNRGIRAQRGGIFLLGRNQTVGSFVPVPTASNHQPRQYEEKFDPEWEPIYLASPGGLALPRILTNLAALIAGSLRGVVAK